MPRTHGATGAVHEREDDTMRLEQHGNGYIITALYDGEAVSYEHATTYSDALTIAYSYAGRCACAGMTITATDDANGALVGVDASDGEHTWSRTIAAL
jgi:hypothetical protein